MLQDAPLVSILVLNWNGEKIIRQSLGSIENLTYPQTEVIFIDNNSTDASVEIVHKEFPNFQIVENNKNLGFAAGMNEGIKRARGDLICLYNSDAVAHPTSLSLLVKRILSESSIGLAGGLILYYEPNNIIWSMGCMLDPLTGIIWSEGLGQQLTKDPRNLRPITDLDYLSGCVLLVKREVIQKIGLLDEGYFIAGEDLDFCMRAKRAGYKCVLDPSAVIWHIGSYSLRQLPLQSYIERQKSDFRTILLHVPTPLLPSALFFQIVLAPLAELLLFRQSSINMNSRLRARIFAFSHNLKLIRTTFAKRKQIRKLGKLKLSLRTEEAIRFGITRMKSTAFFMGKLLQKT
jgi:GT2 family glycosyltransferase